MQPFTSLEAVAAPVRIANVDTDMIVPARFLTTIQRAGLREALFATQRQDPDFVLNCAPWNAAGVIVALKNFGCGSSREHAPWALTDFGIRCVIAPSFADIFYNNCFKNDILPITLPTEEVEALMNLVSNPATARVSINLPDQTIVCGDRIFRFAIDAERKQALISGADEILQTLSHEDAISRHEAWRRANASWLPYVSQQMIDSL